MKVRTKTEKEIREIGNHNVGFLNCMIPYCDKEIEVRVSNNDLYVDESGFYWDKKWVEVIDEEKDKVIQICLDSNGGLFGLTESGGLLYKERGKRYWVELDMERV